MLGRVTILSDYHSYSARLYKKGGSTIYPGLNLSKCEYSDSSVVRAVMFLRDDA